MQAVKEKVQFQKYTAYKNSGVEWVGGDPGTLVFKKI